MKLTEAQVAQYNEQGYLFFPGLLADVDVAALQEAMPAILERQGPEVIREKDGVSARLVFGAHEYSEPFRRLSLLPRVLNPVRQLLEDEVYLHQSRMNPKEGFDEGAGGGDSWAWHQDYPPWHTIDGMPTPRCIMVAVFVDACTAVNSPLLVLPRSHEHGFIDSVQAHKDADGYALHHLDRATVERLAAKNGVEALVGPAGSVGFIDCLVLHGSANNVSPWRRAIMYLIYNAVSNACTGTTRPWFQNNRDFSPLQPIRDDSLGGSE